MNGRAGVGAAPPRSLHLTSGSALERHRDETGSEQRTREAGYQSENIVGFDKRELRGEVVDEMANVDLGGRLGEQPTKPLVTYRPGRARHPRVPSEVGMGQRGLASSEGVSSLHDHVAEVRMNRLPNDRGRSGHPYPVCVVHQRQVCGTGIHAVQCTIRILLADVHGQIRIPAIQLDQRGCQQAAHRGRESDQPNDPTWYALVCGSSRLDAPFESVEHLPCGLDHRPACGGEHDPPTGLRQHRGTDLPFESFDLLGDRRRGVAEFVGRPRKSAEGCDGPQGVQSTDIDHEAKIRSITENASLDLIYRAVHTRTMITTASPASTSFGTNVVAMATPMHPDGSLDRGGVDALLAHLSTTRCDGVVVAGTTGEAPTLTRHEISQLISRTRRHRDHALRVTAGVGTNDTSTGIEMARSAAAAGADALLITAPYYSRPTQTGIAEHIVAIAEAGGLPVMVYDVPARTGVAIEASTLEELSRHPLIGAVKDAKGDLYEAMTVMSSTDLAYYCGIDELALPYLASGATGLVSVTGNVVADRYAELIDAVRAGDLLRANAVQRSLLPLTDAVMRTTQGAVMAKAALARIGVISDATVRRPLLESSAADLRRLDAALSATGIDQESRSRHVPVRLA